MSRGSGGTHWGTGGTQPKLRKLKLLGTLRKTDEPLRFVKNGELLRDVPTSDADSVGAVVQDAVMCNALNALRMETIEGDLCTGRGESVRVEFSVLVVVDWRSVYCGLEPAAQGDSPFGPSGID